MAVATRPDPRMTVPVLVTKLGEDGSLLMISEALSAGGWVVIPRDWNLETAAREAWGLALPTVDLRALTAILDAI